MTILVAVGPISVLKVPNHQKIVFWHRSGVKWGKINMCHKIKKFSNRLMNHFPWYSVKIPKFDIYHPPTIGLIFNFFAQ